MVDSSNVSELVTNECVNFEALLRPFMGRCSFTSSTGVRRVQSSFGLRLTEIAACWLRLTHLRLCDAFSRRHLLWALLFLKTYDTESQLVARFTPPPDEKTFRHYVSLVIDALGQLDLVRIVERVCNTDSLLTST
jgi:hypothetical protein